jgi:3-hydroxyisobutyrate dehydrogenase
VTIGYVGLGNMGGALAGRLQLQHRLTVHDRDEAAVRRLTDAGAIACANLPDLASRCGLILLCLPTSDQVHEVIFGEDGLAGSLKAGTLIVDQTSGDPTATRAMAADVSRLGAELIDAPVSGGVQGAEAGTIAIMVGASPELYARVHPVLTAISPNVFHTGGVGTGHTMKLVNNLLSCAQRLLTFEGTALAAKNGIEPRTAVEILLASGGRNGFLEQVMGPHVVNGELGAGFTLGLAHKDVRLACQLGLDSEVPMFFGNLTRELYQLCISELGRDAKVDTAALVVDRLARTQVVPPSRADGEAHDEMG